jgi:subtilisin family serine protease
VTTYTRNFQVQKLDLIGESFVCSHILAMLPENDRRKALQRFRGLATLALCLTLIISTATTATAQENAPSGKTDFAANASKLALKANDELVISFSSDLISSTAQNAVSAAVDAALNTKAIRDLALPSFDLKADGGLGILKFDAAISESKIRAVRSALLPLSQVDAVQANLEYHVDEISATSTTQSSATWGIDRIDETTATLDGTFSYANTGLGVYVYVVDTGITNLTDEFGTRVRTGVDIVNPGTSATDCAGHGTHVAGTIGSKTYGVAKQAYLVPVRVLDCQGSGSTSQIVAGLNWIIANHPEGKPGVVNMSLGADGTDAAIEAAVVDLYDSGLTVVAASGNGDSSGNGLNACNFTPARVPQAITVNASTKPFAGYESDATFSNYGECTDIYAPGVDITSLSMSGAPALSSGTSMATPHVSGAVALMLQAQPALTPAQVTSTLLNNATNVDFVRDNPSDAKKFLYASPSGFTSSVGTFRWRSSNNLTMPVGDGYNESSVITIESPTARTVNFELRNALDDSVYFSAQNLVLGAGESGFSATVTVPAVNSSSITLGVGSHAFTISTVGSSSTLTGSLKVGSGKVTKVVLNALNSTTVYPLDDGLRDTVDVRIATTDETGTQVASTGSIWASCSPTGTPAITFSGTSTTPAVVTFDFSSYAKVACNLRASATTALAVSQTSSASSANLAIYLKDTGVSSIAVLRSVPTVYPVIDDYRDSVDFTVHVITTPDTPVRTGATATIKLGTKVVKRWYIPNSGDLSVSWNGRYGSSVVEGTYDFVVSAKGTEGAGVIKSVPIVVSKKKLSWTSLTKTYTGAEMFSRYRDNDVFSRGLCNTSNSTLICQAYGSDLDTSGGYIGITSRGSVAIPSAVINSYKLATPKARMQLEELGDTYGCRLSEYGAGCTTYANTAVLKATGSSPAVKPLSKIGWTSTNWASLASKPTSVTGYINVHELGTTKTRGVKVQYYYAVLQ